MSNYLIRNLFLGFVILVAINIMLYFFVGLGKQSLWIWVLAVIPLLWAFSKIKTRTSKFYFGLSGENAIDDELNKLGREYICIRQGMDTERGNIDKIVIGPTGIWVLEVKSHTGNITFDGDKLLRNDKALEKNFLKQAYAEAKTLEEFLRNKTGEFMAVNPVVVFSSKFAKLKLGMKQYKGVYVVRKDWLIKLIVGSQSHSLNEDNIEIVNRAIIAN